MLRSLFLVLWILEESLNCLSFQYSAEYDIHRKYLNVYVILQLQNVTNFSWNLVHFNLYQFEGRSSLVRQLNFTILTFSHYLMYMYATPCSILESLQQLRCISKAYKLCLLKMTSARIA